MATICIVATDNLEDALTDLEASVRELRAALACERAHPHHLEERLQTLDTDARWVALLVRRRASAS